MTLVKVNLKDWYKTKNELIKLLVQAADSIDQRHNNVCKSRIAGNTFSSIGAGMLIAGVSLAPLTVGTSLPLLAVAGGVIGCLGNATSIGGVIYEKVAQRKDLKKTKQIIEQFYHETEVLLSREASIYWNFLNCISPAVGAYSAINVCLKFLQIFDSVTDAAEATTNAGALFTNSLVAAGLTGRAFGKFALHVSVVLSAIGIAIDTIDTTIAANDIVHHKNQDKTYDLNRPSKRLREFVLRFENLRFEEIEKSFVRCNAAVSVVNRGHYSARLSVTYFIDGKKVKLFATEGFGRKQTVTKEFLLPKIAKSAYLKIETMTIGCSCNLPTNFWRLLLKQEIKLPYFKVYKLTGTNIFPKIKQII